MVLLTASCRPLSSHSHRFAYPPELKSNDLRAGTAASDVGPRRCPPTNDCPAAVHGPHPAAAPSPLRSAFRSPGFRPARSRSVPQPGGNAADPEHSARHATRDPVCGTARAAAAPSAVPPAAFAWPTGPTAVAGCFRRRSDPPAAATSRATARGTRASGRSSSTIRSVSRACSTASCPCDRVRNTELVSRFLSLSELRQPGDQAVPLRTAITGCLFKGQLRVFQAVKHHSLLPPWGEA